MGEEVIVPLTSIQLLVQPPVVIQHKTTRCPLSPEVCIIILGLHERSIYKYCEITGV